MTRFLGWYREHRGPIQNFGSAGLLLVAAASICWYLLADPGQFPQSNGRLVILTVLAAVIISIVLLRDKGGGPWLFGLLLVSGIPVFLLLAMGIVPEAETREGIRGFIYLYAAGAVGGLVQELVHRHHVELPSVTPPPPPPPPGSSPAPAGPLWNLGFLSRMLVGGLAGLVVVTLIGQFDSTVGIFATTSAQGATQPAGLVWALVAGAAAPAVWDKVRTMLPLQSRG